jgi:hypothetical protein
LPGAADDASPASRIRIEDHSLLADLYFTVSEPPGALVDVQDGTRRGLPNIDEAKAARDRPIAEETLAAAEHYGEKPDA